MTNAAPQSNQSSSEDTYTVNNAASVDTFTGLGFDVCETPSISTMSDWLRSPYRAVNVYVGGEDRACKNQPNLTASWVHKVTRDGWAIVPTYVGLQAPCFHEFKGKMKPNKAAQQGTRAADDAADDLGSLGMGAGSPVYYDLEPFDVSKSACDNAVVAFISAWSKELHKDGYVSGLYAAPNSGMGPIVAALNTSGFVPPDDIWIDYWNGTSSTLGLPGVSDELWANHQRMHQYFGSHDETHGGATLDIDSDAVNAATVGHGSAITPGPPFVFQAYTNGTALNEYSTPSQVSSVAGTIRYGGDVPLVCQTSGENIGGTPVWDQLTNDRYVSDDYVTTPGYPTWSAGIPRCASSATPSSSSNSQ
jgi:Domain of unknown function (DUF1906)